MIDGFALLKDLIDEKLKNKTGGSITGTGYDGLLKEFNLTGKVSISKFREALGTMNFNDRSIKVTYSERQGLSDMEPREITVTRRR